VANKPLELRAIKPAEERSVLVIIVPEPVNPLEFAPTKAIEVERELPIVSKAVDDATRAAEIPASTALPVIELEADEINVIELIKAAAPSVVPVPGASKLGEREIKFAVTASAEVLVELNRTEVDKLELTLSNRLPIAFN